MNALMPKAISLTLRTSTAAAAAARSFERTASMRWPRLPRLTAATSRQRPTVTASTSQPKTGLGSEPSRPRKADCGPRSRPSRCGSGRGAPLAAAPGLVEEAELRDRHRRTKRHHREADTADAWAETAVSRPSSTAAPAPSTGASGNPIPASTARWETVKPATPRG